MLLLAGMEWVTEDNTLALVGVEARDLQVVLPPEGWVLESGETLPELVIRYETYGVLNAEASNAVLICAPLTADAHAAGRYLASDPKPGWWDPLIGPGKAIDTNRFFVICSNLLGGCRGTTGPSSINPRTGKPYGSDFPNITIGDMVSVQKALVNHLGIDKLHGVVGGSMGGFQAMKWAIEFPDCVKHCIIIAATTRLSSQALGFEIVGRDAILSDPQFFGGDYYQSKGPQVGLASARKLAHITYLSAISMEQKFERVANVNYNPRKFHTGLPVQSYLEYQGQKFVERFDANSYLHITWAMDQFDLEGEYGSLHQAFARVQCDTLNVNLSSDWLFPPHESRQISMCLLNANKVVTSVELESPYGHDAFLLEVKNLSEVIRRFLGESNPLQEAAKPVHLLYKDREDFALLEKLIVPGSRILDLGCGDGRLIDALWRTSGSTGVGIDRDFQGVLGCLQRSVPVLQLDLDSGLEGVADNSFDYVVLNRTLQEVRNPRHLLQEMMRVGRKTILSFPNFGHWHTRLQLMWKGRMPKSAELPHEWYDTPNIHLFTLRDFLDLCHSEKLEVEQMHCIYADACGRLLGSLGARNLGASQVVALVGRRQPSP